MTDPNLDPIAALQQEHLRQRDDPANPNGLDQNRHSAFAAPKELVEAILDARDYSSAIEGLAGRLLVKTGLSEAAVVAAIEGLMLLVDVGRRDYQDGRLIKDRWRVSFDGIRRQVAAVRAKLGARLHPQAVKDGWPEPAAILSDEVEVAPAFPISFLPGALADFTRDITHRMQCPTDILGIPLLLAAATAIGTRFRMAPKDTEDDWTERACLWGTLILPVGSMKSPAFSKALQPLRDLQADFHRLHERELEAYQEQLTAAQFAEKTWKEACRKAGKAGEAMPEKPEEAELPKPPKLTRLLVGDVTQEALVDLIKENPHGLLQFRDELSGWFASFNQYRPGADRQFYLECHAGSAHQKDRRLSSVLVDELYLNLGGGVQPQIIRKVFAGGDLDGMLARFSLMIWPNPIRDFQYIRTRPDHEAKRQTSDVIKDLYQLDPTAFFGPQTKSRTAALRFDEHAQPIFDEWYIHNQLRIHTDREPTGFTGHLSKYAGLFARLAIVHHLIRHVLGQTTSPVLVNDKTASAVRDFIDLYLEPHAKRIYLHLGGDALRDNSQRVANWILDNPEISEFTARDIRRKGWAGLTAQKDVNTVLDHLENVAGWVRCSANPSGPTGGRPTTTYRINPLLR